MFAFIAAALIVITQAPVPAIIPAPREVKPGSLVSLARGLTIESGAREADRFAAQDFREDMKARGVSSGSGVRVVLRRLSEEGASQTLRSRGLAFTDSMRTEGYVIAPIDGALHVVAASDAGMFYGVQTVKQLVEGSGKNARLHMVAIRDWPAIRWRGYQDDLSRGPVPSLEFQKKQIRTMAAYKANIFSPYFEHTLAYGSQPLIGPPGGAMSASDVKELVAYAAKYHIDVVPEQEAFGHLHHMLKYDLYTQLAETPHGHVLAPGQPGSVPLIADMFDQVFQQFPSRFIHLGADETFELGKGQTSERVKRETLGAVYIDFLNAIDAELRKRLAARGDTGRRFLFWADIAENRPDLVSRLPKNMVAVAWDYWASKGFARKLTPFTNAGMETWVAPGVNNWVTVYPNFETALANIKGFVTEGYSLGAKGVLNTSWDDDGESLFNQTWFGMLYGAAASWEGAQTDTAAFRRSYGRVFHGDSSGHIDAAQRLLGAGHLALKGATLGEASNLLFWVDPFSTEGQDVAQKIRPVSHQLRVAAESALVHIDMARRAGVRERDALEAMEVGARRMDLIGMKFQLADEIVLAYAKAAAAAADSTKGSPFSHLVEISAANGRMQDLRDAYTLARELYEQAWLRENKPYWLYNVLNRFDLTTQLWLDRAQRAIDARRTWTRTRRLVSAADLGIPTSMPGLVIP